MFLATGEVIRKTVWGSYKRQIQVEPFQPYAVEIMISATYAPGAEEMEVGAPDASLSKMVKDATRAIMLSWVKGADTASVNFGVVGLEIKTISMTASRTVQDQAGKGFGSMKVMRGLSVSLGSDINSDNTVIQYAVLRMANEIVGAVDSELGQLTRLNLSTDFVLSSPHTIEQLEQLYNDVALINEILPDATDDIFGEL